MVNELANKSVRWTEKVKSIGCKMQRDEIEYDEDLTEDDVIAAASDAIEFPAYDPDDFPFDVDNVDVGDIEESIEEQLPDGDVVYLKTSDGQILCFEDCEVISRDEAVSALAKEAQDVDFDMGY